MLNKTTNITIRTDMDLKKQADKLFSELGINMTTAINMFLRQAVRKQAIPFEIARDLSQPVPVAADDAVVEDDNSPDLKKAYSNFAGLLESI